MKQLFILLLIFKGCIAFGQPTTSFIITKDNLTYNRIDTIPCIILVCDTIHYPIYTPSENNYFDKSGSVIWAIGYEVRYVIKHYAQSTPDSFSGREDYSKPQRWETYTHKEYLDANKHPLSKNIIVWQSK